MPEKPENTETPENAGDSGAAGGSEPDCLFCRIIAGEIPTQLVYDGERVIAFRDINPQAPMHVLVVPRAHAPNLAATAATDPGLVGELAAVAAEVAGGEGYTDYNLVANTGSSAGQTIFHTHLHVLGGRRLTSLTSLPG